jgi:hypothetical protein
MFCPHGHLVFWKFCPSGCFVPPDVLSHGSYVSSCYVSGRDVSGLFVWAQFLLMITYFKIGICKLWHIS